MVRPSLRYPRGRIHSGVEVTESSTNKQHRINPVYHASPFPQVYRAPPAVTAAGWDSPAATAEMGAWAKCCGSTRVGTSLRCSSLRPSRPCAPSPHANSSPASVTTSVWTLTQAVVTSLSLSLSLSLTHTHTHTYAQPLVHVLQHLIARLVQLCVSLPLSLSLSLSLSLTHTHTHTQPLVQQLVRLAASHLTSHTSP